MDVKEFIEWEETVLDRAIIATPVSRFQLEMFVKSNNGVNDFLLMQMAINFGYKLALDNLKAKYNEQEKV